MPLEINPQTRITMLNPEFVQVINNVLHSASETANSDGVILNFRDPTYNATRGGMHPVEASFDSKGNRGADFALPGGLSRDQGGGASSEAMRSSSKVTGWFITLVPARLLYFALPGRASCMELWHE